MQSHLIRKKRIIDEEKVGRSEPLTITIQIAVPIRNQRSWTIKEKTIE